MVNDYRDMRDLFNVSVGDWRDGVYWEKIPSDYPLGCTGYRVHIYGAGQNLHISIYPIHTSRVIRAARRLGKTTDVQQCVNWRHSRERLILLAETNFTEGKDFLSWAETIGHNTRAFMERFIDTCPPDKLGRCYGILNNAKKYNPVVLEMCCSKALANGLCTYQYIKAHITKCFIQWQDSLLTQSPDEHRE